MAFLRAEAAGGSSSSSGSMLQLGGYRPRATAGQANNTTGFRGVSFTSKKVSFQAILDPTDVLQSGDQRYMAVGFMKDGSISAERYVDAGREAALLYDAHVQAGGLMLPAAASGLKLDIVSDISSDFMY